jgi:hypothetical protein
VWCRVSGKTGSPGDPALDIPRQRASARLIHRTGP